MTAATFILMHKQPQDPAAAAGEALKFFDWAYANGDKMAEELDYVPMPDKVVTQIKKTWATEIKDAGGKPVFTATKPEHARKAPARRLALRPAARARLRARR